MSGEGSGAIRWEMGGVRAFAVGTTRESAVKRVGGVSWRIVATRQADRVWFGLVCNEESEREDWSCRAKLDMVAVDPDGDDKVFPSERTFTAASADLKQIFILVDDSPFVVDDTMTIEFRVTIQELIGIREQAELTDFSTPSELSNVVLRFDGGEKIHASREFLSIHSRVFAAMFTRDFVEKHQEEVELKEVVYQEFIDLLHVIYPENQEIRATTVEHILKLADRFQMKCALQHCQAYLLSTKKLENVAKLALADRFGLKMLLHACLASFSTAAALATLKTAPEYEHFSPTTLSAICHRFMQLHS